MRASEVMTQSVITVTPDTRLREVVSLLLAHRISGVLVVQEGKVVGVVGDGDLLHRHEIGTADSAPRRNWWQRVTRSDASPLAYVKSHGGYARDVMNREVTTVHEDTSVAEIAALFERRNIRRVPVLRDGSLVGIVTRADLVRAFAASVCEDQTQAQPDEAIQAQLRSELEKHPWWQGKWSKAFVYKGIVRYIGIFGAEADKHAARIAAENIPGVRRVEDQRISGDCISMI